MFCFCQPHLPTVVDVKPYDVQHGGEKNLLKCSWSLNGEMVSAGSSDQTVHIWDEPSAQELYFLPGHTGSVNEVQGLAEA